MNVLPPGWEVPDALPPGLTIAPAGDPEIAARLIAEHVGGEVVVDVAAAERALADQRSRRRAERVVADADEATRLLALLAGSDAAADRALLAAAEADVIHDDDEGDIAGAVVDDAAPGGPASSEVVARLAGIVGDVTADADAVRAAAARLRSAEVTADAAARVVGQRPVTVHADVDHLRSASLANDICRRAEAATRDAARPTTAANGTVIASVGVALVLTASGLPLEVAAGIPGVAGAATLGAWRQRRETARRLRVDADAAAAEADRARAEQQRAADELRAWEARAAAAADADAELAAARAEWQALAGDADVARAERLADALDVVARAAAKAGLPAGTPASAVAFELRRREAEAAAVAEAARRAALAERERRRRHAQEVDAARERERLRSRLAQVLHGRRLDRLQAEANHARALLAATPAPAALVLCDPLARLGPGRRRALLHELERAATDATFALVTSDEDALAWASARARAENAPAPAHDEHAYSS